MIWVRSSRVVLGAAIEDTTFFVVIHFVEWGFMERGFVESGENVDWWKAAYGGKDD